MRNDLINLKVADESTSASPTPLAALTPAVNPGELVHRVFDCLPSGCFAMNSLLRLLRVVPTASVPTIRISTRPSRLQWGRARVSAERNW